MERSIHTHLLNWKDSPFRKVLLLRGARQVGKTWSARNLGEQFEYFLEINFELDREVHAFFESSRNPDILIPNLASYYGIPIESGKTLVFFDEIQACPDAISALRFFYEKIPALHVLAAGSLLEFSLEELPSYGLGRIESLWMYPMSFDEFLLAKGEKSLLAAKKNASPHKSLHQSLHNKLTQLLRQFMILGGLPEVIKTFIQANDFQPALQLLDQLVVGLDDDFVKYKKRVPVLRLRQIFESVARQTGKKFVLSHAAKDTSHIHIKEAIHLLIQAGLIYQVYHSAGNGLPLGSEINPKKFKLMLFDHGIFQRVMGLQFSSLLLPNDSTSVYRGNLAELFAGLELIKYANPVFRAQLYHWQREKSKSNAELDYLIQYNNRVAGLEIKSGTRGKMQSLHLFIREKESPIAFRSSLENFAAYDAIQVIPLHSLSYLIT